MRPDVKREFEWANQFKPQVEAVIKRLAGKIISVRQSTPEEDMKQATDMVVEVDVGTVAVRVRRDRYMFNDPYADVTIRSYNNGHRTEIHKIREGWGDWYLYAWAEFADWIFYDINKLRENGMYLLTDKQVLKNEIPNKDGRTCLLPLSVRAIVEVDAYVGGSEKVQRYIKSITRNQQLAFF